MAYALLYENYAAEIFTFINGRVQQKQDAEDLTDEVFVRAWKALSNYKDEGKPFSSFLYRIARNLIVANYRKEDQWQVRSIDTTSLMAAVDKGPAELHAEEVLQEELHIAISKLKPDHRDIIVLRFIEGMSISEIAEYTGRSAGTLRVINHRALKALRTIIDEMDIS